MNIKDRNKKGFSLIELVVVIGIITLFAVIAMPKFSKITQQARLAKTKMNLVNIKDAFKNHYYDNFISGDPTEFPAGSADSLLTREWANTTYLSDGQTIAMLFSEGVILYNPSNNPYIYGILPATEFEKEGFILRDRDYNVEVRFRP